ncbi:hypothetical protein DVJ78_07095 [Humibacter sp. BT305]|nr:hypothetical protein DVJ78_07095 [Humibacter sp. BT305]
MASGYGRNPDPVGILRRCCAWIPSIAASTITVKTTFMPVVMAVLKTVAKTSEVGPRARYTTLRGAR